jgi:tetratricopeptide (TPR) repeat protein
LKASWQRQVLVSNGYRELGMFEDAVQALEEIEPEDKSRNEVLYARVDIYLAAKKWYLAAAVASHLVKADPENPAAWINLAYAVRRDENIEAAEERRAALALRPSLLQLARVGEENTTIAEWDIEKAVQARFHADIDTLQRFFSLGDGERMNVIQKIRPVLEGYCRNLYPTQFGEQEMMGGIVRKIRDAGAAHPLFPIVEDLDELNMYCRRYHHSENPNAATEPIDEAELQGYVKRTLKLVGCLL